MDLFLLNARIVPGLTLSRSYTGNHSCGDFMSTVVLSFSEDTVLF